MIVIHKLFATQTKHNITVEESEKKLKTGKKNILQITKKDWTLNNADRVEFVNEFDFEVSHVRIAIG